MSKKIVHYINQFFAGIGGEEKADTAPEIQEKVIGPGLAFQKEFGEDYEIVATVICGDNYFGSNIEKGVVGELLEMIKKYEPDGFIAGPAFNAGRYGVACGTIAKAVQNELGIPVVTGMYVENPGADMFKKDVYTIETKDSSADMRNSVPKMAALLKKQIEGQEVFGPAEEGYMERGIRVNYFHERRGSERAVELIVKKIKGEEVYTDYPMPIVDRVAPAPPLKDLSTAKIALITSGGVVPQGNPDHIESSSATKWGKYSIAGMDHADKADFMTVHGGYDRAFITEDPDLCIPIDALRKLEKEGKIGKLMDYFITTTGTGTATNNAKRFAEEYVPMLKEDGVDAVLLVST
ncbi:glycine reductase [Hespellia stercorisuis DSM 15480]|uniref:Glycine reductase n=3 Tax=Hespellia stercorisuis TaxID=180311 RepID=A0A1M6PA58_9FIRM|nr:glycine reductase [Hespellia stercorisuis DSM 15480]